MPTDMGMRGRRSLALKQSCWLYFSTAGGLIFSLPPLYPHVDVREILHVC